MEVVMGALPSVITKLGDLLVGEYNLQKGVKGEIRFLQSELESMQGALEKVSNTPADQLDVQDRIWARDLRELSYDIEDNIDAFMVHGMGNEPAAAPHGLGKFIDRSVGLFRKAKIRRMIATEIRDIKSRLDEVSKRRDRYRINSDFVKPVAIDPRLFARYEKVVKLVGIDEARDDVIKILIDGDEVSKQDKIVSIVGFGGLGKTTLANVVYEKLRPQFDCSAFISVSQDPHMKILLKDMFYQLSNEKNIASTNIIEELRKFLQNKRYFIVVDDIWDISVWKMIRCALVENSSGCKIITTTRILNVAEHVGGPYRLKPLSLESSRILLYGRIFGNQEKNRPDAELVEVSDRILKKCAGVPLAIITMASLLASKGRNKMEWYEVHNNMGTGMENSQDMENMRKILLLSYYCLPSCLKTCLLYLSVFPEDSNISKDRLIWMWIGEGFIDCENKGKSLFKLGESYFNELINKSMIQPVYDQYNAAIRSCHVHDIVLDLIRSLSSEENFVSILNDVHHICPSKRVRRMSLQSKKVAHGTNPDTNSFTPLNVANPTSRSEKVHRLSLQNNKVDHGMQQVRSVVAFPSGTNNLLLTLHSFRVLRVLDLERCNLSQGCGLNYLGILFHLRFLGLRVPRIGKLPEEIGKLQFLQTLSVWSNYQDNGICTLPKSIVQIRNLMCLRIMKYERVQNLIGSLTSLEELSLFRIYSSKDIEELGHLVELRVLSIRFQIHWNDSLEKSLVECLNKLQNIQSLSIASLGGCNLDAWVAPSTLHILELQGCWFSMLPSWMMNPSLLLDLSFLQIYVDEFLQKDFEILGRLPALRSLRLIVGRNDLRFTGIRRYIIGACSFPCLVRCKLTGFGGPVMFRQGAMPKLTSLHFNLLVPAVMREISVSDGCFDLGLSNLMLLEDITVDFESVGTSNNEDGDRARAYLEQEARTHPNHPTLRIYGFEDEGYDWTGKDIELEISMMSPRLEGFQNDLRLPK